MDRECPKGWILVPSPTDGEYVPYFIQVRNNDFVWDENFEFPGYTLDYIKYNSSSNIKKNFGDSVVSYDIKSGYHGNWHARVHKDKYCELTQKLSIGKEGKNLNVLPNKISMMLNIPISIKFDNSFNISFTTDSTSTSIRTGNISFVSGYDSDEYINDGGIQITNYMFPFDANYETNHVYDLDYIYIKITGYGNFDPPR